MNIFIKYRWLIVIATIIGLASALIFSLLRPAYYDTSLAFSINRINLQTTEDYQYDGYYAIQASDLFSQTVMSWMMTPSVLLEIYQKAQIDPQISSLEEISSRFKTKKYSPQNIVVRYKERDRQTADEIAQAITTIVQEKAILANQTSEQKALFEVAGTSPVIVERKPVIWLNTLIGLVTGFIFSLIAAYLIEYLRRSDEQDAQ
jgi:capsular polysaccharide biosynthesis protein